MKRKGIMAEAEQLFQQGRSGRNPDFSGDATPGKLAENLRIAKQEI